MAKPSPIRNAVGAVLRRRREELGLSQEEVGELADLHRNYVGSVERGERNVSIEALEQWTRALRMSWERLGKGIEALR